MNGNNSSWIAEVLRIIVDLIPEGWREPLLGIILFLAVAHYLPDIIKKWLELADLWKKARAAKKRAKAAEKKAAEREAAEQERREIEASQPSIVRLVVTTSWWITAIAIYLNYILFR